MVIDKYKSGMKIIFFIDNLGAGGTQRRFVEHIKGVKSDSNIEFEVVLMSSLCDYREILGLGIKIHYLIRKTKKDLSVFNKFYKICKEFKPDIVHTWESMTSLIAVPACKLLGIKLVNGMVVDTPVIQNISNKYWLRAKLSFPFSTVIIGNSHAGLKAYGASEKKSQCVYNGMALSRFDNLKDPKVVRKEIFGNDIDDIFVVGMVAAFHPRKDYKTLVRVAVKLASLHDNIRFVLVGNGEDLDGIKSGVPDSMLNKIIFLGKRSDVESIVNIFDIGVLLTNTKVHGEGIANSIIEYMALSKPVIATRGGGTNEAVIDNQNGYLVDVGDDAQVVEKIEFLMNNRSEISTLGLIGNKMVHEKFDLKIMTRNYINVYRKVLEN
jgi:glycosyltransferase involved in cell wall biosynthesis